MTAGWKIYLQEGQLLARQQAELREVIALKNRTTTAYVRALIGAGWHFQLILNHYSRLVAQQAVPQGQKVRFMYSGLMDENMGSV